MSFRGGKLIALLALTGGSLGGCDATAHDDDAKFWRPWYEQETPPKVTPDPVDIDNGGAGENSAATPTPSAPAADPGASTPRQDPDVKQPDVPTTSVATSPDAPPPATPTGPCRLGVTVTTATLGGQYAPSNIGSIWIADQSNRFIKTLRIWADRRREHLDRWIAVTKAAGLPNNKTDAVSAATITGHGVRSAVWDCKDASRNLVPDGDYNICFELTEANGAGPVDCVPFAKADTAFQRDIADRPTFKKRKLEFTP